MTLTILSIYSSTLPVKAASFMQDERIVDKIGTPVHYKNLRCILRDARLLSEFSARAMELSPSPLPPVSGSRQLLVLLVNFTDRAGTHDDVYFENMLWGPRPSLSDYYN